MAVCALRGVGTISELLPALAPMRDPPRTRILKGNYLMSAGIARCACCLTFTYVVPGSVRDPPRYTVRGTEDAA